MPTVFTHVAVPVCAALALGARRVPVGALLTGMLASIAPDFDGLAFKLGIAYGGTAGHRGFTHTLLFACILGLAGAWLAPRWGMRRWVGWAWITLCAASHPLLDMLTNGGIGIAFFWPLSEVRHFSPWRPIEVSPIALSRFFSPRGVQVLRSELAVVWAPLLVPAMALFLLRRRARMRHRAEPA